MNGDKRKFLFVSITGLISDIAWQVLKEGHEVRYFIEDEKERDIADGFVPKVRRLGARGRLGRRHRVRRHARPGREGAGAAREGQARRRRHAVHRPPRGRPLLRPGGAEEGRHQHHALPGLRQLRRRHRLREGEPRALRHQALGRGGQREAAPVRRRRGGRPRRHPHARGLQEGLSRRDQAVPAAAARHRRRGRGGRVLQRQGVHLPASTSTSSTRSSSPETSAPRPARWARRCSGAARTSSSIPR